jgi:hypothetical protein
MERFSRLNEVQYAETEVQRDALIASGFAPAPLPEESADEGAVDDKQLADDSTVTDATTLEEHDDEPGDGVEDIVPLPENSVDASTHDKGKAKKGK